MERQAVAIAQALQVGLGHHRAGRFAEAERVCREILQADPRNPDALQLLGEVAHGAGKKAVAVEAWINRGISLARLGRHAEALASYDKVLAIEPELPQAWNNRGNTLADLARYDEAIASFDRALAIKPDYANAWNNRGSDLAALGRYDEAIASYDRALAIKPDLAEAHNNRGNALCRVKRYDEALASFDRALTLRPAHADGWNNRGVALRKLGHRDASLASYDRALALRPDHVEALFNCGNALQELKRYEDAVASFEKALALRPGHAGARIGRMYVRQQLCDWSEFAGEAQALRESLKRDGYRKIPPFMFLGLPGTEGGEQLACARRYAEDTYAESLSRPPLSTNGPSRAEGRKLRVGFLSADFREHAVSYLIAEIIELVDRSRFDVCGYSYGADDASPMRHRLEAAFDTFRDVGPLSDEAAARLIVEDGIDILVDLTGHTTNSRLGIAALRPAPVQANWLGYPGTLGLARLADYLIGDAVVSPLAHAERFSETLALMPNCFQPNDRKRAIGEKPEREAVGLPRDGFVFCCFNQSYKITPEMFDVWCRLIAASPQCVLWLLGENEAVQHNLRREAQQRGISPHRLVFASRLTYSRHLARFQLADMFLDTLPFNAGATGSDALWTGVPLLTCAGETLPGRYAASLLTAAGLPELITRSLHEYEKLALDLVRDPDRLARVRAKLGAHRLSCALFDSVRFTRDLERLFRQMWIDRGAATRRPIVLGNARE